MKHNYSLLSLLRTGFPMLMVISMLCCKPKEEAKPNPVVVPPPTPITYTFEETPVWQDEFEVAGLPDSTRWDYDTGGNGWGNQELQYYTRKDLENARVEDGHLTIEAHRKTLSGSSYTSARLVTRGKADWKYGKFEIKAKLPSGRGTWPAIWMLPTEWNYGNGSWPDNGEIDIMEHVGYDPGQVHATIHCNYYNHSKNTQKGGRILVSDASEAYHVYTIEWTPNEIKAFVDQTQYFQFPSSYTWQTWPFDKKFHLLLNIAVGGSWGGAQGVDESIWPQRMEVDYVRVYKLKEE
jgi:beta-glucanase (GH16 family)